MFSENLKTLRKSRGFSQEELSIRLNVVRQTISKWEKGVSVPDAEMLIKIAEVLETTVSGLLGEKIIDEKDKNDISQQLSRINEQLAIKTAGQSLFETRIKYHYCHHCIQYPYDYFKYDFIQKLSK